MYYLYIVNVSLRIFHSPFVNDCESHSNGIYNYIFDARIFCTVYYVRILKQQTERQQFEASCSQSAILIVVNKQTKQKINWARLDPIAKLRCHFGWSNAIRYTENKLFLPVKFYKFTASQLMNSKRFNTFIHWRWIKCGI